MSSIPQVTVHKAVLAQQLTPGLPGGSLGEPTLREGVQRATDSFRFPLIAPTITADFAAFPDTQGAAVAGVFRNHGTEPAFDVPSYPEDEAGPPSCAYISRHRA